MRSGEARDVLLTFAGGGNRAFYQLGLMNRWGAELLPRVAAVSSCSAGACVIATFLSGRQETAGHFWLERARKVRRNFDASAVFRGEPPAPQGAIYRATLLHTFADGGLDRIREQPFPIYVLAASLPQLLPRHLAAALGIGMYSVERSFRRGPHPRSPRFVGFRPRPWDMRQCETPEQLADLILASSATPPFTPFGRFAGELLLDGGMIDNAPAFVAEEKHREATHSIVFMSRPYDRRVMGVQGKRLYIAPVQPPPIGRWDYTRPELLAATIALGEREAEHHRPTLDSYLAR